MQVDKRGRFRQSVVQCIIDGGERGKGREHSGEMKQESKRQLKEN